MKQDISHINNMKWQCDLAFLVVHAVDPSQQPVYKGYIISHTENRYLAVKYTYKNVSENVGSKISDLES
jgi:hypothetical protein